MARQLARTAPDVEHGQRPGGDEARGDGAVHVGGGPVAGEDVAGELEAAGPGVVVNGHGSGAPGDAITRR